MIYLLLSHYLKYYILISSNKELVLRNLETDLNNILAWFNINSLKEDPGKF